MRYGFQEGESLGKYEAYIKKQNERIAEAIIQPENERALKIEVEKLHKELKAEERSHTYWREEYYKLLDKRGVE